MIIFEDYVSYETAKLLKEKGFEVNTPCKYADKDGITEEWYDDYRERMVRFDWNEGYFIEPEPKDKYRVYGDTIPAPTLQMAMKWLREVHNLFVFPFPQMNTTKFWVEIYQLSDNQEWVNLYCESIDLQDYSLYEEACEAGIKYCLENLI